MPEDSKPLQPGETSKPHETWSDDSGRAAEDIQVDDITDRVNREGWGFLNSRSVTPDNARRKGL